MLLHSQIRTEIQLCIPNKYVFSYIYIKSSLEHYRSLYLFSSLFVLYFGIPLNDSTSDIYTLLSCFSAVFCKLNIFCAVNYSSLVFVLDHCFDGCPLDMPQFVNIFLKIQCPALYIVFRRSDDFARSCHYTSVDAVQGWAVFWGVFLRSCIIVLAHFPLRFRKCRSCSVLTCIATSVVSPILYLYLCIFHN